MRVYHASNTIIEHPDTLYSRVALDFGQGFYVTTLREQAVNYANRFKLRKQQAYLNIYELRDGWQSKNIKRFTAYDAEWLNFITANRSQLPVTSYDCVEGGIANDRIFRTIDLLFANEISRKEALTRLQFEKPNHQICFLKQALIDEFLSFINAEEI